MRIATYNVNGVRGRLEVLLRWLEMRRPDIVCLQELKAPQAAFPVAALEKAGYGAAWLGQARWNGVAVLSRGDVPIVTARGLPGDPDDGQSRYIEAAATLWQIQPRGLPPKSGLVGVKPHDCDDCPAARVSDFLGRGAEVPPISKHTLGRFANALASRRGRGVPGERLIH